VAKPGTKFHYSTYGYTLLGCVLEGASGKTFVEYLKERVFEPARMTETRDDDAFAIVPHRARGYDRTVTGVLRNSVAADTSDKVPGGGLCGSAPDLARFAIALEEGKLVSGETRDLMFESQQTRTGHRTGYGLGWALDRWRGRKEVYHGGGQPEVSTLLYLRPDTHLTVVLFANLEGVRQALIDTAREIGDALSR